jgi:dTDP-4-dehydrorhamnose 3,5-epimerase
MVGLADLREGSSTYGRGQLLEIGDQNAMGVFIPPGVAHGYLALTHATLIYLVDRYYDPTDEAGVAWNDPTLALPWGIADPFLSERDRILPRLSELDPVRVP